MTSSPSGTESAHRGYVWMLTLVAALGGLLFGYDTAVISGAIGYIQTRFALDAAYTGWAASCALAGSMAGVAISGPIGDRWGRRLVLTLSSIMFIISAFGSALAPDFFWFVFYRFLGGVGIGAASMASPLYIAEISPMRWRGQLVAVNQLTIVSGMLIIYFVNYWISGMGDEVWNVQTGWRWMFASGAIPSLLLFGLLFAVPETPRYLAARGRDDEALRVARKLQGDESARVMMADIATDLREEGSLKLWAPALRPALGIALMLSVLQQVTGINVFLYYAPEIFKHLGSGSQAALFQTIFVGATNVVFTVIAMATVDRWGRRPLMTGGPIGMGVCLAAMGVAAWTGNASLVMLFFVLGYVACFSLSVGPVTWIVLSEIFPTRIRSRAMAFATVVLWASNFVVSQTFPMMDQNPFLIAHFHHAFPFFLYAFFCVVEAVFVFGWMPETKGKSLEEISHGWLHPG